MTQPSRVLPNAEASVKAWASRGHSAMPCLFEDAPADASHAPSGDHATSCRPCPNTAACHDVRRLDVVQVTDEPRRRCIAGALALHGARS